MNTPSIKATRQSGVAVLLSLIILLVLTILGISAFQNSHIQERSAGNMRLQSVAFEAAAAGAANSINFFDANREAGDDQQCGELGHDGWDDATAWVEMGTVGQATLKQRLYCLADQYPDEEGGRPARSQLFVLSRGEVISGTGDSAVVVAQRDIEVRLDVGGGGTTNGDGCGAICFPSCNPGDFDFPNSNVFQVDGNGGPAVTGGCQAMTDEILDGIKNSRIGNYIGGIETTGVGAPWDSPETTELFRENIEQTAINAQGAGGCMTYCYRAGSAYEFGNSQFGTSANPQITYIGGNAYMGGNITGAGIMFVNGNLAWNGTPQFEGLIVTLGGTFTIDGGGHGGDHAGSVVILNQPGNGVGNFGQSNFDNTGGGNALYKFDCDALWAAWDELDATGQALWSPQCAAAAGSPFGAGPGELVIASWRENIGWREEFFGSD